MTQSLENPSNKIDFLGPFGGHQHIQNKRDVDIYNTLNHLKVQEMTKNYRSEGQELQPAAFHKNKKDVMVRITAYRKGRHANSLHNIGNGDHYNGEDYSMMGG